jgi:hypothetical protein
VKSYLALVKMRASAQCPDQVIQLRGAGMDRVLSWVPERVDCGYATPSVEVMREVTFTNTGNSDAHLSQIQLQNFGEFRIVAAQGVDATRLVVPGNNGTAKLTVGCKPAMLGLRSTQLTFSTDLPRQPRGNIPVSSFGGGPDIEVTPFPMLNFGKVAYSAGANVSQWKKLTVMNVGTAPPTPDVQANLRLGQRDPSGRFILPPQPIPLNPNTAVGEFAVGMPATYDPEVGLEGRIGKNIAELIITFTPTSLGLKQAMITLYSNDPDEPAVDVTLSADAAVMPPCNYTVSPTTVAFGLVQPPEFRDLAFTIKNNGTNPSDICHLSSLDIAPTSHAFFSLPNGPIASEELGPGEVIQVPVRVSSQGAAPVGVTNISGAVEFFMSSPTRPRSTVTLTAQIAPSCLTVAPNDLDFGTVEAGCSSATRTFSVYNTCPTPVTLDSFRILGAPANDPFCLQSAGCEYVLVRAPAIPATLMPGAGPTTFEVKYSPLDLGQDINAVEIGATQNFARVDYVVSLKGTGDSQGVQTDVFTQDAKPKADILLVVDNSCSMQDEQQSLATNFESFIGYAQSAQVDYHLAVTTTDMDANGAQGKFLSGPAHPEKILTPSTPDVENKFKAKVNVGIEGSGTEKGAEPALAALTAPLINSDNAGFLRQDAALAVVVITDENDQSANTRTFYLDQFWNIKGHNQKTMFTFNAIACFTLPCGVGAPDQGHYAFYTAQTNGVREEISTPDWATALERLGKRAFGSRTNFFLTSKPDLSKGPIQVKVDNQVVPSGVIWTYDPVANSVNFNPNSAPEPGQTLTITYHVTCFP